MAGKASLEELEWYNLEEIDKVNALIDMENDHQGARQMYLAEKSEKKREG